MKAAKVRFVALFLLYLLIGNFVYGQQNYGLSFNSFNVPQEKRTSLELGTGAPLCLDDDMDLAFDMRFLENRATYFGYIFRMINKAGENIDLLYNQKDEIFNTVLGASFSSINFKIPREDLYDQWTRIRFHLTEGKLQCYINGLLSRETPIQLKDHCFRIIFGACHLGSFSSTDVPPMVIRNIGIHKKDKLLYYWPLKDDKPQPLNDSLRGRPATVTNPTWSGELHRQWQPRKSLIVKGDASYTFDPETERLYVISEDSVNTIHADEEGGADFAVPSRHYHLFQGNQSLYNTVDKKLYNYYIDIKGLAGYNPVDYSWNNKFDTVANTEYGHTSRVFIPEENALYIFGGYGQLRYKNKVQKVDFSQNTWTEIKARGSYFTPRYMAGAGRTGDSIYIFGGYGSHDGDQLLNPRHYYDLMLYNIKTKTFKKIYTLPDPENPFVVAGSMVIDKRKNVFYALVYDENKYDTKLQLIQGSLTTPTITVLGNPIPYAFQDIIADADLFYCPRSKQLLAVTQLTELGQHTLIKVFSIAFPPDAMIKTSGLDSVGWLARGFYWLLAVLLVVGVALIAFYLLRRKSRLANQLKSKTGTAAVEIPPSQPFAPIAFHEFEATGDRDTQGVFTSQSQGQALDTTESRLMAAPEFLEEQQAGLRIYLFGTFEMINAKDEEVSQQFSPLLKELFLMILLFTVKDGKGISSERINDIFWGNKTGKNAKNNLSVNMVRLKSILTKAGNIFIKKEGSRWVCDYSATDVHIDLVDFLQLRASRQKDIIRQVRHTLYFISRGAFLKQTEYRWMDEIKADINNKTIDELLQQSQLLDPERDVEYMIEIANNIFHFDPLSEDALQLKCTSLNRIGRHSLAKNTYERFAKEYQRIYGEPFPNGFNEFVK